MDALSVKEKALKLGADICGIGSEERFTDAPPGFRPMDVLPSCKSVIVFGIRFNATTMNAKSTSPYTVARNSIAIELDLLASKLALYITDEGYDAVPIGSVGPDEYDKEEEKFHGTISLKHAAVLAGLGKMGKNTLLVNDRFGNMLWLAAVLTSADLEADPIAPYEPCIKGCRLCIASCPAGALSENAIVQKTCRQHAFGEKNGSEWKIHCFTCRKVCPNSLGMKSK
jgi:epoxyqueuosine reductase QueG